MLQSALLGAGSLDQKWVKALRARPSVARRYLALEGRRVLAGLAGQFPLAAELRPDEEPSTATADESLEVARGRVEVPDPPDWFGVIRPSRLLSASAGAGGPVTNKELRLEFNPIDVPEAEDDAATTSGPGRARSSNCLRPRCSTRKLYRTISANSSVAGARRGTALPAQRHRFVPFDECTRSEQILGLCLRRLHFTDDGKPGAALAVGGALYPE